jgi:hypothetical protein
VRAGRVGILMNGFGVEGGRKLQKAAVEESPPVMAYREAYAKANSPLLGFIPDFGCCVSTLPPSYLDNLRAQGMPEDLLQPEIEVWHLPQDAGWKRGEFARRVPSSAMPTWF